VFHEFIDHGGDSNNHSDREDERVFPVALQKFPVGRHTTERHDDEYERRNAEGDIGVEAETEDESAYEKREKTFGAKRAKEKVKRKRKNERYHDGAKADPREVDCPVGKGDEKGGKEGDAAFLPELFGEEIDAENRECPEYCREEFERGDVRAEEKDGERLQINEESFATVVVGIEELVVTGFDCMERINAVHRLVRIEPGGNTFDMPEPQKECDGEKERER